MKTWIVALIFFSICASDYATADTWQHATGHTQAALWPGTSLAATPMPGPVYVRARAKQFSGKTVQAVNNISQPTMTVYAPTAPNTGTAVLVSPGGGFEVFAMDLEGTHEQARWGSAGVFARMGRL